MLFNVSYHVIYHQYPINSQYLKTWGVDSPVTTQFWKLSLDLKQCDPWQNGLTRLKCSSQARGSISMVSISVHNMLKDVAASFSIFLFVLSFIAGLHVTSRRPCWWSRTKAFLFSCKFFEEIFFCFDPQHGRLVTWLPINNTQPTTSFNACYTGHMGP